MEIPAGDFNYFVPGKYFYFGRHPSVSDKFFVEIAAPPVDFPSLGQRQGVVVATNHLRNPGPSVDGQQLRIGDVHGVNVEESQLPMEGRAYHVHLAVGSDKTGMGGAGGNVNNRFILGSSGSRGSVDGLVPPKC